MARRWIVVALVVGSLVAAPAAAVADELPLGPSGLQQTQDQRELAPGVVYTDITRGAPSPDDTYTVSVRFTTDKAQADATAAQLRSQGYDARIDSFDVRAPDEPGSSRPAYVVRVGRFATGADANTARAALIAAGYSASRVDHTSDDGALTTGPWRVHVLAVDPSRFDGVLKPQLATDIVPERETVTSIDARTGALAGVNGGYFVIGSADGTPGDLAGLSAIDGQLISEAVNGRTDLVLPHADGEDARVAKLDTVLSARSQDGATRLIDGRNRRPGLIRSCGGVGGDQPTEQPLHDVTCTDPSELIQFTSAFGATSDPNAEVEAALDRRGRVTDLRAPGGPIPVDGSVLSGTGDGAAWLRAHAQRGAELKTAAAILDGRRVLPLRDELGIVNGGPRLVDGGEPAIDAAAEGFTHPDDAQFYFRFGVRRNPRTLAGVRRDGTVLLVTVDGRAPGYSVGLSFLEEAALMRALGAVDAVNLDGGGSTATALGTTLVTRPSDATGERPVGDALVVLAGGE